MKTATIPVIAKNTPLSVVLCDHQSVSGDSISQENCRIKELKKDEILLFPANKTPVDWESEWWRQRRERQLDVKEEFCGPVQLSPSAPAALYTESFHVQVPESFTESRA